MSKQTGLGRGLGALLPRQKEKKPIPQKERIASASIKDDQKDNYLLFIPVDKIKLNPHQPRKSFSERAIKELADSIKTYGILEPLIVTPLANGNYELIAGERRLRSSKLIGLSKVPVIIRESDEQAKLEIALIENIQRKNLNPAEEAHAYLELMENFNLTQEQVAKRVGKKRSSIANTLRILALPQEIIDAIAKEKLSAGHARAIAALNDEQEQLTLFRKIISTKLTVRDTEEYVQSYKRRRLSKNALLDPELIEQQRLLEEKFSTRVKIHKRGGKGKIIIEFYSEEEFSNIMGEIIS